VTPGVETAEHTDHHRCGCCGQQQPAGRLAELGQTPGVFICAGCALWAARRAGPLSALPRLPAALRGLLPNGERHKTGGPAVRGTIPILPSTDLDRTAAFFTKVGFIEEERSERYLLLHSDDAELHFALDGAAAAGQCLVLVGDALALWKRLRDQGIEGVEDIVDQDDGLGDFTIVDPDANRIRIGGPIIRD
jgi:hypothetical protein